MSNPRIRSSSAVDFIFNPSAHQSQAIAKENLKICQNSNCWKCYSLCLEFLISHGIPLIYIIFGGSVQSAHHIWHKWSMLVSAQVFSKLPPYHAYAYYGATCAQVNIIMPLSAPLSSFTLERVNWAHQNLPDSIIDLIFNVCTWRNADVISAYTSHVAKTIWPPSTLSGIFSSIFACSSQHQ